MSTATRTGAGQGFERLAPGRDHSAPERHRGRNGGGRLPFPSQLDVYVQHQLRLGERFRLTISANVIGALNRARAGQRP